MKKLAQYKNSKKVQEYLFTIGYDWSDGKKVKFLNMVYISIWDDFTIGHSNIRDEGVPLKVIHPNPPHKDSEVIKIYFDGADIEFENFDKDWVPVPDEHFFCKKNNYRAKPEKTANQLEIERIESELSKQAEITSKLADDLKDLKDK